MRTFAEIADGVGSAMNVNDSEAMRRYATELQDLETPEALAMAQGTLGWTTYLEGNYDETLKHYHLALAIYEEMGDQLGIARMIGTIGNVYDKTGDFATALEFYHRALATQQDLDDRHGMARAFTNIGIVYYHTGDYPAALEQYNHALDIYESLGDDGGAATLSGNIGAVYNKLGNNSAALQHLQRALSTHEAAGNVSAVAMTLGNLGNTHLNNGDYAEALTHFHRALALCREIGARIGVVSNICNIVKAYLDMGSVSDAQQHFASLDTMQIDEPEIRAAREYHRASLQEHAGDMDGAVKTLQNALVEAVDHGLRHEAADLHKALRDLALKRNDLQSYVEHNNAFTRITDEINGKDTATKLAMQSKQREIDAERRETEKQLAVLHSTLPKHIADRVARGEQVNDHYDNAAVIFLDIVGFTTLSDKLSSAEVIQLLDTVFTSLDAVCKKHDVVKIKTIGDSYMAVAFPRSSASPRNDSSHPTSGSEEPVIPNEVRDVAERAAKAALEMLDAASKPLTEYLPNLPAGLLEDLHEVLQVRIGLHVGAVTAGVLGKERLQYDVWGDTVNVASRMESTGEPGRIHVSEQFASFLGLQPWNDSSSPSVSEERGTWHLALRGETELKGKGLMTTYWLTTS